eukprot:361540_1
MEHLADADIQFLLRVFNKIFANPDVEKYRNLNKSRICKKFLNSEICLHVLYKAGFYQSENTKRLLCETNQLHKMRKISNALTNLSIKSAIISNDKESKLIKLAAVQQIQCDLEAISECVGINRIRLLLKLCYECKDDSFIHIQNKLNGQYTMLQIINDFVHVITEHLGDDNFENIYLYLNIKCDLAKCITIKRNQRNRMRNTTNENVNINVNDRVRVDIIDQIHSYLLHSIDTGYKLTKTEKNAISNTESKQTDDNDTINHLFLKTAETLNEKRKRFRNIQGTQMRINHSKFVTKKQNKNDEINYIHDDIVDTDNKAAPLIYSFSYCFNYWQKDNRLYIEQKYDSLKDEVINNEICKLEKKQYDDILNKAQLFLQSEHAKQIYCKNFDFPDIDSFALGHDIPRNYKSKYFYDYAPLLLHNLIVLILYTDYDTFSYHFSSTYRHQNDKETLKELLERHRNYHWMGKHLRETVSGYGKMCPRMGHEKDVYYHGISKNMIFSSSIAFFNHPTSTTKKIIVAQSFATNEGMVIALQHHSYGVPQFECSWFSAFGNEEESIFIGACNPLKISNIIECSSGAEYKQYLKAINILNHSLRGDYTYGMFENVTTKEIELIDGLIKANDDMPSYVLSLFNSFRNHVTDIDISTKELRECPYLSSLLLQTVKGSDDLFLNLDRIAVLFPKCKKIQFWDNTPRSDNRSIFVGKQISKDCLKRVMTSLVEQQWEHLERITIRCGMFKQLTDIAEQFKHTTAFSIRGDRYGLYIERCLDIV